MGQRIAVAAVALVVGAAPARAHGSAGREYAGAASGGVPVHFVVTPDRRVGAFALGSVAGRCPDGSRTRFGGAMSSFGRVRRAGRFRLEDYVVGFEAMGTVTGRLLPGGRATGVLSVRDRSDCAGSVRWTARSGGPVVRGVLAGGPTLAGAREAWTERAARRRFAIVVGRGSRRRVVRRVRRIRGAPEARVLGMSSSSRALAVEFDPSFGRNSESTLLAGPLSGPLRDLGDTCDAQADADGPRLVAVLTSFGCGGFVNGNPYRVVVRDVVTGSRRTLFSSSAEAAVGPELARIAGRFVAWIDGDEIVVWDRTAPRGPLDRSPPAVYRVSALGAVGFDLDADGTLVVVRPSPHWARYRDYAVDAYWPAAPRAHPLGMASAPGVRVAGGRAAFVSVVREAPTVFASLVVTSIRRPTETAVAAFPRAGRHRVQRLGGFDLAPHRVTWAERTVTVGRTGRLRRAPVRIAAVALG